MNREKLNLTAEKARQIIWEDDEDEAFVIIQDKMTGRTRWSVVHSIVIQRKSDGKYFKDTYRIGATESQDEGPYEYTDPNFIEVVPVTKTYIDYE